MKGGLQSFKLLFLMSSMIQPKYVLTVYNQSFLVIISGVMGHFDTSTSLIRMIDKKLVNYTVVLIIKKGSCDSFEVFKVSSKNVLVQSYNSSEGFVTYHA